MTTDTWTIAQLNGVAWRQQELTRTRRWEQARAASPPICHYGSGATLFPSLAARHDMAGFTETLESLNQRRDTLRMRAMRGTLFLIPLQHVPVVFQATRQRNVKAFANPLKYYSISEADFAHYRERVIAALDGVDLTIAQLKKALSPLPAEIENGFGAIRSMLGAQGVIVRARSTSGWRSDTCTYALLEQWAPEVDLHSVPPEQAAADLACLYFDCCGPATFDDFQWWTGLTRAAARPAMEAARPRLRKCLVDGLPAEYWLPAEVDPAAAEQPGELRLVPLWDSFVMAHNSRERYLAPEWADRVYDAVGNSTAALLVDGVIAGVWAWEDAGKRHCIKVAPFAHLSDDRWTQVAAEAKRLVRLASGATATTLELRMCPPPASLLRGGQNLFKSPLQDVEGTLLHTLSLADFSA